MPNLPNLVQFVQSAQFTQTTLTLQFTLTPWATLVQNALNSYVVLYVVKLGLHRADKWLPWDESIHQKNHSGKVWIQGYSRLSCKGPLKLLNKRPRPKLEYCNNSVIFEPILMKFGMQLSYGHPFQLAKFQQGQKRPKTRRSHRPNFQKVSRSNFNHNLGPLLSHQLLS